MQNTITRRTVRGRSAPRRHRMEAATPPAGPGDLAIELTDEIDEVARLLAARWRLREIAPELSRWYSLRPERRPALRPEVLAKHREEVEQLLALLLE